MAKYLDKTGLTTFWAKIKSTFQTLGNLQTSWGSSPSDTKYPSEKLVKTALDAKLDTKVKATAKTDNVNYKILATASASPTSGSATEAVYDTDVTLNPSTNTISANISGASGSVAAAFNQTDSSKDWLEIGTFQHSDSNVMFAGLTLAVQFRANDSRNECGILWLSTGEYKASGGYSNADVVATFSTISRRSATKTGTFALYYNTLGTTSTSGVKLYAKVQGYSSVYVTPVNAVKGSWVPSMTYLASEPATKVEVSYYALLRTTPGTAVGSQSTPVFIDSYGRVQACTLQPNDDVALILYGDSTYSNVKALYNAGKKLYLVTGGNIQPSGKFEYRIPLTLITYDSNSDVNAFYFEQTQDDRAGASEVGSVAVYRLDSTGWTTTPKQVGYAVNAGAAAHADTATNADSATNAATANYANYASPGSELDRAIASKAGKVAYKSLATYDTIPGNFHDTNLRKQLGQIPSMSLGFSPLMVFCAQINFSGIEYQNGSDFSVVDFELFNNFQPGMSIGYRMATLSKIVPKGSSSMTVLIPFSWTSGSFGVVLYGLWQYRITAGSANVFSFYYGVPN